MFKFKLLNNWYRFFFPIIDKGKDNVFNIKSKLKSRFLISVYGNFNKIEIGEKCSLNNAYFSIFGDNNIIIVDDNVRFLGPCNIIMEGNSLLHIGSGCGIRGVWFVLKGANIIIGKNCMFSYDITLRNHDSHRIFCSDTGKLLNPAKDIILGDHIWVGQKVTILKGVNIGDNSIIGFGSIVTKGCESGSVLAGTPARIVRNNVNWDY